MKHSIKLFVSVRLKSELKIADVNIDKAVNVLDMLKIVSEAINFNLLKKIINNNKLVDGANILLDEINVNDLNGLDSLIEKNTTIFIALPNTK